jgi:hypothetical protein
VANPVICDCKRSNPFHSGAKTKDGLLRCKLLAMTTFGLVR